MKWTFSVLLVALAITVITDTTCAITVGQVDSFSVLGDALGWTEGQSTAINPPVQNPDPGANVAPGHLEIDSDGAGPGGRQHFWNDAQWTGDYISVGVDQISLFADNRSSNGQQIDLRLGFYGGNGGDFDWYVTDRVVLPDNSGWTPITYDITPTDLIFAAGTAGTGSASNTLSNVLRVEILSESGAPFSTGLFSTSVLQGDLIISDLRIDVITAHGASTSVSGDYNNNGKVDGADYTVWLASLGAAAGTLLNDGDGGLIGQAQYDTWKSNFGMTAGTGSVSTDQVPEPSSALLLVLSVLGIYTPLRNR